MSAPIGLQRIAFLGNYVPRMCGIATFTHDLHRSISCSLPEADCYVGAVTDKADSYNYPDEVRFQIQEKDLRGYHRSADLLNFRNADVLCVQHEFGIYGGAAGNYLLALLREVRMPIVTTLHTILENPTKDQGKVMEELSRLREPFIVAGPNEREGYVPNVVYSCGSMLHGGTLVLPYAISDYATVIATIPLVQLLHLLLEKK